LAGNLGQLAMKGHKNQLAMPGPPWKEYLITSVNSKPTGKFILVGADY
jgi:hypothetical protein